MQFLNPALLAQPSVGFVSLPGNQFVPPQPQLMPSNQSNFISERTSGAPSVSGLNLLTEFLKKQENSNAQSSAQGQATPSSQQSELQQLQAALQLQQHLQQLQQQQQQQQAAIQGALLQQRLQLAANIQAMNSGQGLNQVIPGGNSSYPSLGATPNFQAFLHPQSLLSQVQQAPQPQSLQYPAANQVSDQAQISARPQSSDK
eukprot:TRINITY_DN7085_c0_g4_i1.p1 TRINITY_DN7085_c0_g4~~TRINITY_DN7085_c0_g4_i1.p1  ORF type:complete len:202 (+),score=60.16 TRINITY_DN7085_c0_g4_i1:618-1223(+)